MAQLDFLSAVKYRIGVLYSDPARDASVQGMIDACKQYLKNADVPEARLNDPLALDACVLWCKLSESTAPGDITGHPALVSMAIQLRNQKETEAAGNA